MLKRALARTARIRLLLRHLRAQPGLTCTLFLIVAATSLVMAAIPRLYNQVLDRELQYQVEQTPPVQANISVNASLALPSLDELSACEQGLIQCRPEVIECRSDRSRCVAMVNACQEDLAACMEERAAAYQEEMPGLLRTAVVSRSYSVGSPELLLRDSVYLPAAPFDRVVRLRFQSDVEEHIELTAGHMPEPTDPVYLSTVQGLPTARGERPVSTFEIALGEAAADAARLDIGTVVVVRAPQTMALRVAGIFRVTDPEDDYWYGDRSLDRPLSRLLPEDDSRETIVVTALTTPEAYRHLQPLTIPALWSYSWRYFIDPEAITVANYDDVADELGTLQLTKGDYRELWIAPEPLRVTNGLAPVFARFTEVASLALSIAALAAIGILSTGVAALSVVTLLIAARRRRQVSLLRGRGATPGQLLAGQMIEGFIIGLPAAALGYFAAALLVPARTTPWAFLASAATGAVAVLLLVITATDNIRSPLIALFQHAGDRTTRPSPRRLMAEGALVLLAGGGIYLLRQRGLSSERGAESVFAFDVLLAGVPVLLALAVGVASLRAYPILLRGLSIIAQHGRSLVIFFGFRRAARQTLVDHLPLLVMLLAVGISTFAAVIAHSVDEAQQDGAWQEVGADFRIEARDGSLPERLNPEAIAGVERAAAAFQTADATIPAPEFSRGDDSGPVTLLAVDTATYASVTAGTRAAPDFPAALLSPPETSRPGTASQPIPVIVSERWPAGAEFQPEIGQRIPLSARSAQTGTFELTFEVVEVRRQFPGIARETPFVVAPFAAVQAAMPRGTLQPTTLYVRGGEIETATLEAALRDQYVTPALADLVLNPTFNVEIVSRADLYGSLVDAPLIRGIASGFVASVALAAAYASIAALAALVLSAQMRARDLGYLRTLGLSTRQALGLSIAEHLPAVLIAALLGAALGIGMAFLVEPGLDLSAFVGPDSPVAFQISWLQVSLVAASLIASVSIAIAGFSFYARSSQLGEVLRVGDA